MLSPKQTKFRKYQKGKIGGIKPNSTDLKFGKYGIKALEAGRITARTIEAVRRVMTRKFKRSGQIWVRIFPDIPVSTKPAEVRMGKGKGVPSYWICRVQPGQILYEIDGVDSNIVMQASLLAYHKLPIKTNLISTNNKRSGLV